MGVQSQPVGNGPHVAIWDGRFDPADGVPDAEPLIDIEPERAGYVLDPNSQIFIGSKHEAIIVEIEGRCEDPPMDAWDPAIANDVTIAMSLETQDSIEQTVCTGRPIDAAFVFNEDERIRFDCEFKCPLFEHYFVEPDTVDSLSKATTQGIDDDHEGIDDDHEGIDDDHEDIVTEVEDDGESTVEDDGESTVEDDGQSSIGEDLRKRMDKFQKPSDAVIESLKSEHEDDEEGTVEDDGDEMPGCPDCGACGWERAGHQYADVVCGSCGMHPVGPLADTLRDRVDDA